MDVATGAAVANNDAIGTVVPPSSTKDKGAYVGVLVAFKGTYIGAFADSAGQRADNNDVVESMAGKVGHKDRGPHRFDHCG